ncbi:hypothetical protein BGW42_000999 [Actinomortierella wolfii]|nr:hypothetical protein BGW42_000999 [Actinomortierella wolfii]
MNVPIEIVNLILDHVDPPYAASTMYSCLTVSKTFFAIASVRLYQDPFRLAATCKHKQKTLQRLIRWVLWLSPQQDEDVVALRRLFGVVPYSPPTTTNGCITTDYLGLLQKLTYHNSIFAATTALLQVEKHVPFWVMTEETFEAVKAIDTIFWAACGHQLSRMLEIVVCAGFTARYQAALSKMVGIQVIWLVLSGRFSGYIDGDGGSNNNNNNNNADTDDIGPFEISTQGNWRFPEISVRAEIDAAASLIENLVCEQEKVQKERLAAATTSSTTATTTTTTRQPSPQSPPSLPPAPPLDVRLCNYPRRLFQQPHGMTAPIFRALRKPARLSRLGWYPTAMMPSDSHDTWPRMLDAIESIDLSAVQIIDQPTPNENDFVWLPEQRRSILQQCCSLKELHLELYKDEEDIFAWAVELQQQDGVRNLHTQKRSHPSVMPLKRLRLSLVRAEGYRSEHPFMDAMSAFGATLEDVEITAGDSSINLEPIQDLPRLRRLMMIVRNCVPHPSAFDSCPRLESLHLEERCSFAPRFPPSLQLSLPTGLTELTIIGPLMNRVEVRMLEAMPNLARLYLHWWRYDSDPAPELFNWGVAVPRLPRLRTLDLLGTGLAGFRSVMLVGMPALEELSMCVSANAEEFVSKFVSPKTTATSTAIIGLYHQQEQEQEQQQQQQQQNASNPNGCQVSKLKIAGGRVNYSDLQQMLVKIFPTVEDLAIQYCRGISSRNMRTIQKQLLHLEHLQFVSKDGKESYEWTKIDVDPRRGGDGLVKQGNGRGKTGADAGILTTFTSSGSRGRISRVIQFLRSLV